MDPALAASDGLADQPASGEPRGGFGRGHPNQRLVVGQQRLGYAARRKIEFTDLAYRRYLGGRSCQCRSVHFRESGRAVEQAVHPAERPPS